MVPLGDQEVFELVVMVRYTFHGFGTFPTFPVVVPLVLLGSRPFPGGRPAGHGCGPLPVLAFAARTRRFSLRWKTRATGSRS